MTLPAQAQIDEPDHAAFINYGANDPAGGGGAPAIDDRPLIRRVR